MKKLTTTILDRDGEEKEIYVFVDNETAKVLLQFKDTEIYHQYIVDEYKMQWGDFREKQRGFSLEEAVERKGFDVADDESIEENTVTSVYYSKQNIYKSGTSCIDTVVGYSLKKRKLKDWIYDNNFTQPYMARKLGITKAELQRKLNEREMFDERQIRSLVRLVGARAAIDIIYFPTIEEKRRVRRKTFGSERERGEK